MRMAEQCHQTAGGPGKASWLLCETEEISNCELEVTEEEEAGKDERLV